MQSIFSIFDTTNLLLQERTQSASPRLGTLFMLKGVSGRVPAILRVLRISALPSLTPI